MKRAKRMTRRQIKAAKKLIEEMKADPALNVERPARKPVKPTSILTLTQFLQKQAERKHAKMHEREDKRAAKADKKAVRAAAKEAKRLAREAKEAKRAARATKEVSNEV